MVPEEPLVGRETADAKPGALEQPRLRDVHAARDRLPVEVAHRVVDGAGGDEREELAEERPRPLVVEIEQAQQPQQDMIAAQPAEHADGGDVEEAEDGNPRAPLHRAGRQQPVADQRTQGLGGESLGHRQAARGTGERGARCDRPLAAYTTGMPLGVRLR